MKSFEDIDVNSHIELIAALVQTVETKNEDDIKKMRLLIEEKLLDPEWDLNVLLPVVTSNEFKEHDFSKLFYNVPYKLMDVIAETYDDETSLTQNKYSKSMIFIITNIIEADNGSLNLIISLVDYLNKMNLKPNSNETTLKLRFHIINELFIGGIRRLNGDEFVCSELLKVIVVSYMRLFIRISMFLKTPMFIFKRIYVFARDFMPPEHTTADPEEVKKIGELLLMYLFKGVKIIATSKNSFELLDEKNRIIFKELGTKIYQLALSYDVDFDQELVNINNSVAEFKGHFLENCKDKTDDEIQDYLYHLAIVQDIEKDKKGLVLDYQTVMYLFITNYIVENSDAPDIPIETLLVSYFKLNALHTANDYNDPFIFNGVLETKIQASKETEIDLPEPIITQVLQQFSFQGEKSIPTIKKILSLMNYKYQIWYILDTLSECPLDEVKAHTWKYILPEYIKMEDKATWISLCNIADIQVLKYTEDDDDDDEQEEPEADESNSEPEEKDISEKLSEKYVIECMMEFLGKYKSLAQFVKGLQELIAMYESFKNQPEESEEDGDL